MKKNKIIITAGATREYIDPVRYISNKSSGKMGFALAKAALKANQEVLLISTVACPEELVSNVDFRLIELETAEEMLEALRKEFIEKKADLLIMAAAVADYKASKFSEEKIKRDRESFTLSLKKNPDIIKIISQEKSPNQMLIGFALETNNLVENAHKKLKEKGLDIIVANTDKALGADESESLIIFRDSSFEPVPFLKKEKLAEKLIKTFFELQGSEQSLALQN
jgi:phosphopantothenoylcysteine decarboxylase / phosphopantothenate---cysteine ligase